MSIDVSIRLGTGDAAIAAEYTRVREQLPQALRAVQVLAEQGLPHFKLPSQTGDLADIAALAGGLTDGAKDLVILGIGGSSLGAKALCQLAGWGTPAQPSLKDRPHLHFVENLDGRSLAGLLSGLDPAATKVLAVSKSGSTTETLAQLLIVAAWASARGADLARHCAVIAEPGNNALRQWAQMTGCPVMDHDPALGGRYSVLSCVGLVPSAVAGLDIRAIRHGAAQALAPLLALDEGSSWAQGAALNMAAMACGRSQSVLWAYADRLEKLTLWWRQLWGESLGKQGKGSTPINALGPVDQHSQLQLYLDGPNDKLITIITTQDGDDLAVPADAAGRIGQSLLGGRTVAEIVNAQARATAEALVRAGRTVRVIHVPRLGEQAMGALMMHFILETLVTAQLLGVDPFDQ
ncbi:MAG TPA: glucose-6-phosphate isomerase, partial [Alphaproteobacteria bacterium]|nr:glucose-6-phosphate isomerase [Alphaproteobacteria bacterium]